MEPALIVIPLLAVLAPILVRAAGRFVAVPLVVFELVLGIVAGPSVLGWAEPSAFVDRLSDFGVAMLFFVAGSELEFGELRGRTGIRAIGGWIVSLALGIGMGLLLAPGEAGVIVGIALCSTALGTILPILRDADELRTPFGRVVGAIGAVGEFGPLLAISVFLGGREPGVETLVLLAFVVLAVVAIVLAMRMPHHQMHGLVTATLRTSSQFAIRVLFLVLAALVSLSVMLDLDMLLGAMTAGIVWRLLMRDAAPQDRVAVESKVEAVAFGFLIPVFFIYAGVTFDLTALLDEPLLLLLLPVGLIVLVVVRGIPSMFAAPAGATMRDRAAIGLFGATGLPVIVAVTAIGVDKGMITTQTAALLVGIGMLSVLVFPLVAMGLRSRAPRRLPEERQAIA